MFGFCEICGWPKFLIVQTNLGVRRRMCRTCCEDGNQYERVMKLSPAQKAMKRNTGSWDWHETPGGVPRRWLKKFGGLR